MPTKVALPYNDWRPRPHQMGLWAHLQGGGARAIAIWHRRAGKDEVCLHHTAVSAFQRVGNYWHCLPIYKQGRKAIWTAVNAHTGKRRIDEAFPKALRETTNDAEMFIRFRNGSTWQVIGSDHYDTTVGSGALGITYSEWAYSNPSAWGKHKPMLDENKGWAVFISTPRGRNHCKAMYDMASRSHGWFAELLTARDTGALTEAELREVVAEYAALHGADIGRAQFEQEYLCFKPDALVMCHDRPRPISAISPGDIVLTHTGRFRRVEQVMSREYAGPLCRIEAYGSPDIVCTPEHPVYTCDPLRQSYAWKAAKDIAVGDWLVTPRLDMRQPPLISADLATVIAWYVSDGHVHGNAVVFSIGAHKDVYIEELCAALTALGREATVREAGSVCNIAVCDVALADFLVGQCGSLAHHKRLPLALLRGNEEVVWNTLFKGDGHVQQREGRERRFCYVSVSEGLTHQVVILGAALGYAGKIGSRPAREYVIEGRVVNGREAHQVQLGRNVPHYNSHNGKTRSAKNGMLGRVRAVSIEDYAGPVHNIEVAEDNSYVVNGRAVHNCSWNAAILGAFYALEMMQVRAEGRIAEIDALPDRYVHRAWDLGVKDDTSIWWFQVVGAQIFILDHYAASGVGLDHYAEVCEGRARAHGWLHGHDFVPHDAKVREWGSGRTRVETMQSLGMKPLLVPFANVADGINAVRMTLPRCIFHPRTEETGIAALEQYRREWDDDKKAFKASEVQDWTCHPADSFRYLAQAWQVAPRRPVEPKVRETGYRIPPPHEPRRGMIRL